MELEPIEPRSLTGTPLTSLVMLHAGHRFHCAAERGRRSYTWIIRMDGQTLRFARVKRALCMEEVRAMAVAAYEGARLQGLVD